MGPFHHGSLDQTCIQYQQLGSRFGVNGGALRGRVQLAPGGAFAVQHGFPTCGGQPRGQVLRRDALLFEVVKLVVHTVLSEPRAGFFDGVAVGDAI